MKQFKPYNLNQPLLISPDLRDWLPEGHLAEFVSDVVEAIDMSAIYDVYYQRSRRGQPPTDPRLLLKLLIYGYSTGVRSARRIEKATHENVAFRYLSCDTHPDHDVIAHFRSEHSEAFAEIFLEVLRLCQKAGLVKLGHVSLDGTKIKANAKKSKSRKYSQLLKTESQLEEEIRMIIAEAEAIDKAEDATYGRGRKESDLPKALVGRKKRLSTIKTLIAEMDAEAEDAKSRYKTQKEERANEDRRWMEDSGEKFELRPPRRITGLSTEQVIPSRRNPTDYASRIMKDHQTGGFIQAYNCQLAVDESSQVIVAADVFNQPTDKNLLKPMLDQIKSNAGIPVFFSADNGYYSERNIASVMERGIDAYIPPTRDSFGRRIIRAGRTGRRVTLTQFMKDKLGTKTGKKIYRLRKTICEPVFGQYKAGKNLRQFHLRGENKVNAEWQLMAIAHNIGKLRTNR